MDAGRRLLGDAPDFLGDRRVPAGPAGQPLADRGEEDGLLLARRVGQDGRVLLGPGAQVDQQRGVAAVVEDHVRAALAELEDPVGELPVLLRRLALAGEHRRAPGGDGRRRVILGRDDVAGGPPDLGAQRPERLDQDGRLDGHVEGARDPGALERLPRGVLLADRHQRRHLALGDGDLLAPPVGERKIGHVEVGGGRRVVLGGRCGAHRASFLY